MLAASFCGLTVWSWRKWPDVLVDFGRELYTPWQLASGHVLYRDVAAMFGPASQYFNAALFRLFGVSLTTLVLSNLAIIGLITVLTYRIFVASCNRLAATVAALVFLTVFAFSQYIDVGNYNFVCPYAHETTHGMALIVTMIFCFSRYAESGRIAPCAFGGICLGLTFLTKPEIAIAATGSALLGFTLIGLSRGAMRVRLARSVVIFAIATLLPSCGFFLYFLNHMPAGEALAATMGAWRFLLGRDVSSQPFYHFVMGMDTPYANLVHMGRMLFWFAVIVSGLIVLDFRLRNLRPEVKVLGLAAVGFVAFMIGFRWVPWSEIARPLPFLSLASVGLLVTAGLRYRHNGAWAVRLWPLSMWAGVSALLLVKMILNARLFHYGFYLAMPAALLLAVTLVHLVPAMLAQWTGGGAIFRAAALAMTSAAVFVHLDRSHDIYRNKDLVVGTGGDAIVTPTAEVDQRGRGIALTLERTEFLMERDATFVVLPEGVMLNYLLRRTNPTPYINFMPPELRAFGEGRMLESLVEAAPDFVLLVHKVSHEYGVGPFGQDPSNGQKIMNWVRDNYEDVETILHEPFQDHRFGVKILERCRRLKTED